MAIYSIRYRPAIQLNTEEKELEIISSFLNDDQDTVDRIIAEHNLLLHESYKPKLDVGLLLHYACKHGKLDAVKSLTQDYGYDPQRYDQYGNMPLHIACRFSHTEIVIYLVGECSVNVNTHMTDSWHKDTPLHIACRESKLELVRCLVEELHADTCIQNGQKELPLHIACEKQSLGVMRLVSNCDVNVEDKYGQTPLHLACQKGIYKTVQYLIVEKHADPSFQNSNRELPLHKACQTGSLDVVKLVSNCDIDVNTTASYGYGTPLHIACRRGAVEIVKFLIEEKHAKTNIYNRDGLLPIHIACEIKSLLVLEMVSGCCVNSKVLSFRSWNSGETALHIACKNDRPEIVKYLVEVRHADPSITNRNGELPLHIACEKQSLDMVKLVSKVDVNTIRENRDTPLHIACKKRALRIVRYLIEEKQAKPTIKNNNKELPLHIACDYAGSLDMVKLVDSCDVDSKTCRGDTALHIACSRRKTSIVKHLTEIKHADPTIRDRRGFLPLHIACQSLDGSLEVVQLVSNCDVNTRATNSGCTPLHIACKLGHLALVKLLIEEYGSDPDCKDGSGNTALNVAHASHCVEIANYLVQARHCDAEVLKRTEFILNSACKQGDLQLVKSAVKQYGSIAHYKDTKSNTALHAACASGNIDLVKYLIEKQQCDQNILNTNGELPLHIACAHQSLDLIKLVSNCDVNTRTKSKYRSGGNTPLHIACETNIPEIVEYLVEEKQANQSICNGQGKLPLHIAFAKQSLDVAFKLVSRCNDVNTALYIACCEGSVEIVKFLTENKKARTDKPDFSGELPLHVACQKKSLGVVKLISNCNVNTQTRQRSHKCGISGGHTPLHFACKVGEVEIVKYLIEEKLADPNIANGNRDLPLHFACKGGHHPDLVKLVSNCDVNSENRDGETPLYIACQHSTSEVVKYLIEEKYADLCTNSRKLPLHNACHGQNLEVVKLVSNAKLVTNAQGDTPLHYACGAQIFNNHQWTPKKDTVAYLIEEIHLNPNIRNNSGRTPLHYACRIGASEVVKYLLSTGKVDPLIRDHKGQTPLMFTSDPKTIRVLLDHGVDARSLYLMYAGFFSHQFSSVSPPPTPMKVLVIGNAFTGKTTLIQTLKCENGEVLPPLETQPTVGIVPSDFESNLYGSVTWYDFAGQHEYYASHEALVHHIISSSPLVILLLVNMNEPQLCEFNKQELIKQNLLYWLTFIEHQCSTGISAMQLLTIIGSHADEVIAQGGNPEQQLHTAVKSLQARFEESSVHLVAALPMDCRIPESPEISKLRLVMKDCSNQVRDITIMNFTCHCLYVFLLDKFRSCSAVCVNEIIKHRKQEGDVHLGGAVQVPASRYNEAGGILEYDDDHIPSLGLNPVSLLPSSTKEIVSLCEELSTRGHIIFLKNLQAVEESWVIVDKEALLTEVNGTVFAPQSFKQHKNLATSTGVVPYSKVAAHIPQYDTEMLVAFLTHLEFCQEIKDQDILQLIHQVHPEESSLDRYFFFPGLVSIKTPQGVWKDDPDFTTNCGWILQCSKHDEFFTALFLQILVLRLSFSFPLALPPQRTGGHPALKQRCTVWKNGISWMNEHGIETVFEMMEQNQALILMMRCTQLTDKVQYLALRSAVIQKVLKTKEELCPKLTVTESFIDPSDCQYPPKTCDEITMFSLRAVAQTITYGYPYIVCDSGKFQNKLIDVENLLYLEPYEDLKGILEPLFRKESEDEEVSDEFLKRVARSISIGVHDHALHQKQLLFMKMLNVSQCKLQKQNINDPILQVLQAWRDSSSKAVYAQLREELSKFSVFCGRDPMVREYVGIVYRA